MAKQAALSNRDQVLALGRRSLQIRDTNLAVCLFVNSLVGISCAYGIRIDGSFCVSLGLVRLGLCLIIGASINYVK